MAEEDDLDFDLYGTEAEQNGTNYEQQGQYSEEQSSAANGQQDGTYDQDQGQEPYSEDIDIKLDHPEPSQPQQYNKDEANQQSTASQVQSSGQGQKRSQDFDEQPPDPNATSAILVSELNWWINDEDIRGWANASNVEDQLTNITFHEHKVNGKSKGQVYISFSSTHAASTVYRYVDDLSFGPGTKKHTVEYSTPTTNPFKTLVKDGPSRGGGAMSGRGGSAATASAYERPGGSQQPGFNSGFRGRGRGGSGGYVPRGGGGYQGGGGGGGFNTAMSGFQGTMGNMGGFNNSFNRGGGMMGGMRGRGGFNNNSFNRGGGMMMGGGMGVMPMQMNNPMNMGMNMGMNSMGGGFNNNNAGHFNPAFFQSQMGGQGGGGAGGGENNYMNPHGAKRPRPE